MLKELNRRGGGITLQLNLVRQVKTLSQSQMQRYRRAQHEILETRKPVEVFLFSKKTNTCICCIGVNVLRFIKMYLIYK